MKNRILIGILIVGLIVIAGCRSMGEQNERHFNLCKNECNNRLEDIKVFKSCMTHPSEKMNYCLCTDGFVVFDSRGLVC